MARQMNGTERLAHMEKAIADGGSVFHDGRVIMKKEDLPSLTDLATNNEERAQAAQDLEARKQRLADEEARLNASQPAALAPSSATIAETVGGKEAGGKAGDKGGEGKGK